MAKPKVVVTGASGYIAARRLAEPQARYDLILLDARPPTREGKALPDLRLVDLTHPDRHAYRRCPPEDDSQVRLAQRIAELARNS